MKITNKQILIVVVTVGVLLFYWYQIRPAQISKACWTEIELSILNQNNDGQFTPGEIAAKYGGSNQGTKDDLYKNCLRSKGVIK